MIKIEKYTSEKDYPRHKTAHAKGGIFLKDEGQIKDVAYDVLKRVGSKLKDGAVTDILKISRPAMISYHKTYLEAAANDLTYTRFLDMAAQKNEPLERMKYVLAFFIAGLHRNSVEMLSKGPLNPILGETFHAIKQDGSDLYCEQISHHPPVTAFILYGANKAYKLYGTGEVDAKLAGLNNIGGRRIGKTVVEFQDSSKISYEHPEMIIDALVIGERRLNYMRTCSFNDIENNLTATVTFKYDEQGTVGAIASKMKGLFWRSEEKPPSDTIEIVISKIIEGAQGEKSEEVVCKGSGSWVSFLQFDGQVIWRVNDSIEENEEWNTEVSKLPSDSTFREDSKCLKKEDYDNAQKEKDSLEELQRHDKKLRAGKATPSK